MYVFAAGNSYDVGQDVNYAGYQNSRFTITVGAVHADMTHSDYSSSGAPVFISAPGGDGGNMAVATTVGNGVTDNCATRARAHPLQPRSSPASRPWSWKRTPI